MTAPTTNFPIIIAEWERNAREVVRVSLDCYRGLYTIDIRVWWFSGKELKPGKTGITLAVRHVNELAGALTMARDIADKLGIGGSS